jgi:hypothetical protein
MQTDADAAEWYPFPHGVGALEGLTHLLPSGHGAQTTPVRVPGEFGIVKSLYVPAGQATGINVGVPAHL